MKRALCAVSERKHMPVSPGALPKMVQYRSTDFSFSISFKNFWYDFGEIFQSLHTSEKGSAFACLKPKFDVCKHRNLSKMVPNRSKGDFVTLFFSKRILTIRITFSSVTSHNMRVLYVRFLELRDSGFNVVLEIRKMFEFFWLFLQKLSPRFRAKFLHIVFTLRAFI